jgi:4-aminobutyrate aminotransferase-like enzyme
MTDRSFLCQHLRPEFPALESAQGMRVTDADGVEYLDFASQTLNLNFGQLHPEVISRVEDQIQSIQYTSSKYSDPTSLSFAKKLAEITPDGLSRVNHKMTGGSLANECAIKMARRRHEGDVIAVPTGSFFGETLATMKLGSSYSGSDLFRSDEHVLEVEPQRGGVEGNKTSAVIEGWKSVLAGQDEIFAVVTTPLEVNAGLVPDPEAQGRYLATLKDLCNDIGAALILDEAQTAFGWLDDPFATTFFDVTPDILTLSKGIAAGFPLGATVCQPEYDNLDYGEHEFTYGAHPVSCAAGLATLSLVSENNSSEIMGYFSQQIQSLGNSFDCITETRQVGLIASLRFDDSVAEAKSVLNSCINQGLLLRVSGDFEGGMLIIKPPIILDESDVDEMVSILCSAIKKLK